MAVTNLKLVEGVTDSFAPSEVNFINVDITPPVTNDSPYYMHVRLDGGSEALLRDEAGDVTSHVVLSGQTKTFGPYQSNTAPTGLRIVTDNPGTYVVDFSVFQSGGNKLTPVLISLAAVPIDTSDEIEAYNDLRVFWNPEIYPDSTPSGDGSAVYVVLYARDVSFLTVLGTGVTSGGTNSAMICNQGESLIVGPFSKDNLPTIYTPDNAGSGYLFSFDVVKRGS
jgi:hypothetical protein